MKKLKAITLLVLMTACVLIGFYYSSIKVESYARSGIIDFNEKSVQDKGVIPLNGEWEFYWNQLLTPEDFLESRLPKPAYMKVPGIWTRDIAGVAYKEKGRGTYRLILKNIEPNVQYGLKKQNIRVASRIYVNGEHLSEDGHPSDDETGEEMGNFPQMVYFEPKGSSAEVIIQVSNFKYYSGGIVEPIRFGLLEDISKENNRKVVFEAMTIALVIGIGFMYVILAFLIPGFRKKEPAVIVFPVMIIMFAIVNGALSERIIKIVFRNISTELLIRIEYVAACILFVVLVGFVNLMEERLLPKALRNLIVFIYSLYAVAIIFTPMKNFGIWISFTYITFVVLAGMLLWVLFLYIFDKPLKIGTEAHSFLLVLLFITNIYNVDLGVFTFGYKADMNLAILATALYAMIWFYFVAYRYDEADKKNEELSVLLIENYYNLEKASYHARRSEMAFLQAQIKPHFLFNSLSAIIGLCHTDSKRAAHLLTHLSDYLKSSFDVDMSSEYIHIESELNIIYSYVSIEKERFGERLNVWFNVDPDLTSYRIIPLLIQPLVENALRHGILKREDGGTVGLSIQKANNNIVIIVEDNGPGFSKRARELMDGSRSESMNGQSGVGIRNVKDRLRYFYNEELHIEEKTGEGVKVWFKVPIIEEGDEIA